MRLALRMRQERKPTTTLGRIGRVLCVALVTTLTSAAFAGDRKPNVLLLIADDLRCEMGCYGSELARTPNLDRLAETGVLFERAYCQFPLCNPSRTSMLTGLRPTTVGVLGNRTWFGATRPGTVSLVRHFRNHGYATIRAGKVFHGGIDDTDAWSEGGRERYFGQGATAKPPARTRPGPTGRVMTKTERSDRWIVLPSDGADQGDHRVATRAIERLRDAGDEPFFLACGFSKPHSPLAAPQRFYDLFDADEIPLPIDYASRPTVPDGFPAGSIRPKNADLFVGRESTPQTARAMIRAYLASSAWMDFNAGRVLDALESFGLADDTIVVFWGDHGYQLGEKGKWSKAGSLWEQGARNPLIVRDPRAQNRPARCSRVVEMIDLYPTLCELCNIPPPESLEGLSLAPLLSGLGEAPERPAITVWSEDGETLSGVRIRTNRWCFAEFFGRGAGVMLTDPIADPDETQNLADRPEHQDLVRRLSHQARAHAEGFVRAEANTRRPLGASHR